MIAVITARSEMTVVARDKPLEYLSRLVTQKIAIPALKEAISEERRRISRAKDVAPGA